MVRVFSSRGRGAISVPASIPPIVFTDGDWPSILNRPIFDATTNTLSWTGPLGGGPNDGSPVRQHSLLTDVNTEVITSSNGQILQGLNCLQAVRIRHNNVTLRQCRISNDEVFMVEIDANFPTGVVVEDCMFQGTGVGIDNNPAGWVPDTGGGGSICRRCNFLDLVHPIIIGEDNMQIQDNWIHDLETSAIAHTDGIIGSGGFTACTIYHNAIYSLDTSDILSQNEIAAFSGLVINNNILVMDNGSACIVIRNKNNAHLPIGAITITNNLMGKGHTYNDIDTGVITGPIIYTGNVDRLTGAPVNIGD